ncbi:MAG: hypothetical protein KIT72_19285 [Polyangiaceae bacterium]|nr:hypothetical protein [Polyangiaceae bacterium]MCW5792564.1 hypothetical protein [Polyangiaceae bacterium]
MATEDDKPNAGLIGTATAAGAIAMVAICAVLTALVRSEQADEDHRKNAFADEKPLAELVADQHKALGVGPRWLDQEKGRVQVPIDRAMVNVVKDLQANPQAATAESEPVADADAGAATDDAGAASADAGAEELAAPDAAPEAPKPEKQGDSSNQPPPGEEGAN